MRRLPTPPLEKSPYFRVEAILEAPLWALILAIVLMTIAVVATAVSQV